MRIEITNGTTVLATFQQNPDKTWRDVQWGEYPLSQEDLLTEIEAVITGKEIG